MMHGTQRRPAQQRVACADIHRHQCSAQVLHALSTSYKEQQLWGTCSVSSLHLHVPGTMHGSHRGS